MSPLYQSGDYLFIQTIKPIQLKLKDKIIFTHHTYGLLIKEIVSIQSQNESLWVKGLNQNSLSTIQMGPVSFENILGKVLFHIRQV